MTPRTGAERQRSRHLKPQAQGRRRTLPRVAAGQRLLGLLQPGDLPGDHRRDPDAGVLAILRVEHRRGCAGRRRGPAGRTPDPAPCRPTGRPSSAPSPALQRAISQSHPCGVWRSWIATTAGSLARPAASTSAASRRWSSQESSAVPGVLLAGVAVLLLAASICTEATTNWSAIHSSSTFQGFAPSHSIRRRAISSASSSGRTTPAPARPCFNAFLRDCSLPSGVRGPVLAESYAGWPRSGGGSSSVWSLGVAAQMRWAHRHHRGTMAARSPILPGSADLRKNPRSHVPRVGCPGSEDGPQHAAGLFP